jgi:hypothetical protein
MKPEQAVELVLALAGGMFAAAAIAVCVPVVAWLKRVRAETGQWPGANWPARMTRLSFASGLLGACGLFLCQIIWVMRLI